MQEGWAGAVKCYFWWPCCKCQWHRLQRTVIQQASFCPYRRVPFLRKKDWNCVWCVTLPRSGPRPYETVFKVTDYDSNNHRFPLVFQHSTVTEIWDTRLPVFKELKFVEGYKDMKQKLIVDYENSIDSDFRHTMHNSHIFLDFIHVKKNMAPQIRTEKTKGMFLHYKALHVPCRKVVEEKVKYGLNQLVYLGYFKDEELYMAFLCCRTPYFLRRVLIV